MSSAQLRKKEDSEKNPRIFPFINCMSINGFVYSSIVTFDHDAQVGNVAYPLCTGSAYAVSANIAQHSA